MRSAALELMNTENTASEFIPYSHHITDKIISTVEGNILSIFMLKGRSHQCADTADVFRWCDDLNEAIRAISDEHVSLWSHIHRRRVYEYPDAEFENNFCRQLDSKYRETFTGVKLMVNDLYLTVVYRPVVDKVMSFFEKFERESPETRKVRQARSIERLEDINRAILGALAKYGVELLGTYEDRGHVYSSALEWLGFLVNGEKEQVPVCRERFREYLCVNRPLFSTWGEVGELRLTNGTRHFGIVEVRDFETHTEPGHINTMLECDFEFVIAQSFAAMSIGAAKGFFQRHKQQLVDAKDVATSQIVEIDQALDELVSGRFVAGEYYGAMTVYAENASDLRFNMSEAKTALIACGLKPLPVDTALEAAYWAALPGNWQWRPRPMVVTSLNFLSFSSFHNFMSGKPAGNPWGPAVTILKTISGTPLYFNFHVSGLDEDAYDKRLLGHTGLFGQAGSGKSAMLGFLVAQAQKFNPTVVAFDKDRGLEIAIRTMGGRYLPLKNGEPSGFNPLQLEPTAQNLTFLRSLLRKLGTAPGVEVNHHDERGLDHALESVLRHIEKPYRRLSSLIQFLPDPIVDDMEARPTLASRLARWCEGGEFGWLFDNPKDLLDLNTHRMYGFDVTDFLENPETRTATMMYLIFRTEGMIDGRRFMYIFDEFWKLLDDPAFTKFAKDTLKTIRKKNGLAVFATQEPGDALNSPIAKTIVQQLATTIALYNPGADEADYVEGLKFSKSEFDLIQRIPEGSRRFLVKQADASALGVLNLSGFQDEMLVLSGTPDNAEILEQVISEVGEDPEIFLPAFIRRVRGQ
jgi:type IV secretion system protein VirB4